MGFSKRQLFNDSQNQVANYTKVLGHPARIAMIQHISENNNCNCNQLVKSTGLSQPTISQHLGEIRKIGLLKQNVKGKNLFYSIDLDQLNECRRVVNDFFVKTQINCNKS
ncbi:ArsR family transcriptional regulator [Olleya aquimaris]|uniref:Winged helix-turn-helix transcriptional regulator n=1 Tax=Olleya sediminilitoris TaxID=2795739 RepID=A0ABS1WN64_9FLAO|nr:MULTISPECIES: metalloregulator ArsR/SmtB family transcription factor [Olleya]AXO81043.1 ArsR family transcriptional regulator [Olleya aquimaris]MBL7560553.1 winged helix-turn-helix transcriptional regulator [Olleya sediminilitoris]